jgi:hypothetical protein
MMTDWMASLLNYVSIELKLLWHMNIPIAPILENSKIPDDNSYIVIKKMLQAKDLFRVIISSLT